MCTEEAVERMPATAIFVYALSVCLRDSAGFQPCTFGTHKEILQSFLDLRFRRDSKGFTGKMVSTL